MENKSTWALLGLGGLVSFLASMEWGKPASAAGSPGTTIGTGSLIQERPLPPLGTLGASSRANYVRTFQSQLNALGIGTSAVGHDIGVNGNWEDADTVAAVNRWLSSPDNTLAARAYNYAGGGGQYLDMAALMNAVDDQARSNTGDDPASDYRAPLSGSAGLPTVPEPHIEPSGAMRGGVRLPRRGGTARASRGIVGAPEAGCGR